MRVGAGRAPFPARRRPLLRLVPLGRPPVCPGPTGEVRWRTPRRPTSPGSTSPCAPPGPTASRELAPRLAAAGASSSTTRRPGAWTPTCPWWCPRSTPTPSTGIPKGIVANPNCTTMVAMPVLRPAARRGRRSPPGGRHLPGGVGGRAGRGRRARRAAGQDAWTGRPSSPSTAGPSTSRRRPSSPGRSPTTCCPWPARLRRRRVGRDQRGAEVPRREPQDPRPPRPGRSGHLRPGAGVHRAQAAINAEFDRALTPERAREPCSARRPASSSSTCPPRWPPPGATPPWWAGCAGTDAWPTAWRCSSVGRQPAQGGGAQRRADRRGAAAPVRLAERPGLCAGPVGLGRSRVPARDRRPPGRPCAGPG